MRDYVKWTSFCFPALQEEKPWWCGVSVLYTNYPRSIPDAVCSVMIFRGNLTFTSVQQNSPTLHVSYIVLMHKAFHAPSIKFDGVVFPAGKVNKTRQNED